MSSLVTAANEFNADATVLFSFVIENKNDFRFFSIFCLHEQLPIYMTYPKLAAKMPATKNPLTNGM